MCSSHQPANGADAPIAGYTTDLIHVRCGVWHSPTLPCPVPDDVSRPWDEDDDRAFANPCLYCGTDDDDVPYEDTEEHRDTSQHQHAVLTS